MCAGCICEFLLSQKKGRRGVLSHNFGEMKHAKTLGAVDRCFSNASALLFVCVASVQFVEQSWVDAFA